MSRIRPGDEVTIRDYSYSASLKGQKFDYISNMNVRARFTVLAVRCKLPSNEISVGLNGPVYNDTILLHEGKMHFVREEFLVVETVEYLGRQQ